MATCLIFFEDGACDLDAAVKSLASYGLTVSREGDTLTASRPGSPEFRITMTTEPHVTLEAAEIGEGTPHADAMKKCTARFEVSIDDLDAALDEINTLIEVQTALQDASQGYLFLTWNGKLSAPWRSEPR
ncbi:MAG: hypothetical protein ACRC8S_07290 [Fimbriiglobus sp.]